MKQFTCPKGIFAAIRAIELGQGVKISADQHSLREQTLTHLHSLTAEITALTVPFT